jgi:hypothetical protein
LQEAFNRGFKSGFINANREGYLVGSLFVLSTFELQSGLKEGIHSLLVKRDQLLKSHEDYDFLQYFEEFIISTLKNFKNYTGDQKGSFLKILEIFYSCCVDFRWDLYSSLLPLAVKGEDAQNIRKVTNCSFRITKSQVIKLLFEKGSAKEMVMAILAEMENNAKDMDVISFLLEILVQKGVLPNSLQLNRLISVLGRIPEEKRNGMLNSLFSLLHSATAIPAITFEAKKMSDHEFEPAWREATPAGVEHARQISSLGESVQYLLDNIPNLPYEGLVLILNMVEAESLVSIYSETSPMLNGLLKQFWLNTTNEEFLVKLRETEEIQFALAVFWSQKFNIPQPFYSPNTLILLLLKTEYYALYGVELLQLTLARKEHYEKHFLQESTIDGLVQIISKCPLSVLRTAALGSLRNILTKTQDPKSIVEFLISSYSSYDSLIAWCIDQIKTLFVGWNNKQTEIIEFLLQESAQFDPTSKFESLLALTNFWRYFLLQKFLSPKQISVLKLQFIDSLIKNCDKILNTSQEQQLEDLKKFAVLNETTVWEDCKYALQKQETQLLLIKDLCLRLLQIISEIQKSE